MKWGLKLIKNMNYQSSIHKFRHSLVQIQVDRNFKVDHNPLLDTVITKVLISFQERLQGTPYLKEDLKNAIMFVGHSNLIDRNAENWRSIEGPLIC